MSLADVLFRFERFRLQWHERTLDCLDCHVRNVPLADIRECSRHLRELHDALDAITAEIDADLVARCERAVLESTGLRRTRLAVRVRDGDAGGSGGGK